MRRVTTLPLLCGLTALPSLAEDDGRTVVRTRNEVPPGFEAFFQRQETVVDVYYAGRFLTTARASFDVDDLTFDDPAALAAQLPELVDPARVALALSGGLPTNAELLCGRRMTDGCGRLEPEVAGVIFDASRFRAELFVAREEIRTRGPGIDRYLPESDARFSVLQNVAANYSGASDGNDAYTVQSATSVSWGETHLQMDSAWSEDDDLTIDALAVRREFRGRSSQAGLFRTAGQSLGFAADRDIVGMRFGSSLRTRADRAFSDGTPIAVFLPERSRVEILQDGRLLSSSAYEAGNQILDTSGLPEGAYEVQLRIREIGGRERIERRFFVKTTRIPPRDQPLWSVEFGRVVDRNTGETLPEDTGEWFARASYTRRIDDDLGVDFTAAGTDGEGLLAVGAYRITELTEVQFSTFAGTSSKYGVAGFGRLRAGAIAATLDWRLVRGPGQNELDPLVGNALDQYGLTMSAPFAGGRLAMNARYDERGGNSSDSQGVSWDRYVNRGQAGFRFSVDVSRQDGAWVGIGSVQYDFRGPRVVAEIEPGVRFDETQQGSSDLGLQTRSRVAWERDRSRGSVQRFGLTGIGGVTENRVGADALVEGRYGIFDGQIDRNFDDRDRTTWTGQLNTSFLSDGNSLSVGGRDRARSAALIAIDGDVPDAVFEVLVDGFPQGTARAGSVTPIHLRPWRSYEVRLRPIGDALLAWENRERTITLYPGNVVRLEWDVAEVSVLFGRIVDADGQPLENARIDGAYGFAMTETAGLFQAEVVKQDANVVEFEVAARSGDSCRVRIDLSEVEARRGIHRVGTRTCE